ncbi:MAG TPA: ATPase, T2SS/T4P/T4SS family [Candidatus Dojkabacteria bacterium]|nr:ATPase, T2SS/T4P/T4SS family [Candidatus Dojkabacteria bacterium]HQF36781.1 ATPase, T2SS/T4P/T4SS family [Candidatus Dojkabacteria bacterium]
MEDDKPLSKARDLKLRSVNFETDLAYNGREGIEKLQNTKYDLILTDIMMPEVNGFEVLEYIMAQKMASKVVVMSNLSSVEDEQRAKDLGAVEFVVKSRVGLSEIIELIKKDNKIIWENCHMNALGLDDLAVDTLQKASKRPFGMIIVSGPTGSGKTTTLYSILNFLNNPDINITTIEDPVEYKTERVNQIQVNTSTGLTFAKGLRTMVRQDPDVILVGEIRDRETAEIAVNAALTGHLLLTTFHANDSSATIPRLIDMGIDPFLLSSTISLIIAQRLARVICESCKTGYEISKKDLLDKYPNFARYVSKDNITLFKGKGCDKCKHTGHSGRIGLFEIIKISSDLQNLINAKASAKEIWAKALKEGPIPMYEDGVKKVISGLTTIEEIERVTNVD